MVTNTDNNGNTCKSLGYCNFKFSKDLEKYKYIYFGKYKYIKHNIS